jgi:hypothetical protein
MFRNYDGAGGRFGETSLPATSADPERLAVYAARRADGALTILVLNKTDTALQSELQLRGGPAEGTVGLWRYSAADLGAIRREASPELAAGAIRASYPAASLSLLVVAPATPGATASPVAATGTLPPRASPTSTPGPTAPPAGSRLLLPLALAGRP